MVSKCQLSMLYFRRASVQSRGNRTGLPTIQFFDRLQYAPNTDPDSCPPEVEPHPVKTTHGLPLIFAPLQYANTEERHILSGNCSGERADYFKTASLPCFCLQVVRWQLCISCNTGCWRVFDLDYRDRVFQHVLTLLEEEDWSYRSVPLEATCNRLEELEPRLE